MSVKVNFQIIGMDELVQVFKDLPQEFKGKGARALKASVKDALEPVLTSARNLAPYETGRLRGAIRYGATRNPRSHDVVAGVGVDLGKNKDDPSGAWYAYIVHHKIPFLLRAHTKHMQGMVSELRTQWASRLARLAKKAGQDNARKVAAKVKAL